jgi:hypothetical protein
MAIITIAKGAISRKIGGNLTKIKIGTVPAILIANRHTPAKQIKGRPK